MVAQSEQAGDASELVAERERAGPGDELADESKVAGDDPDEEEVRVS